MKFLSLVIANLKRKKLRTVLTVLSAFIAFLLFGLLCALKEGLMGGVNIADADRLIVRNKVTLIQPLPVSYEARIARIPGVDAVAVSSWFGGIYQDPKNFFATIPVKPETFLDVYREFKVPEDQRQEWLRTRNGAIVGPATMKRFGWKIGDTVPLTSPIWGQPQDQSAWEFKIVGTYEVTKKGGDTTTFYFRHDYFDEGKVERKGLIGWTTVRVKDPDQAAAVAKAIDTEFENSPYETKAEPEGAFASSFAQQVGDIGAIVAGVVSAVFFTILLVAGNTMGQAVRERTEEIGVLKAMGFTNGLVLVLVLMESCFIAVLGGFIGLGLAWLIASSDPIPTITPTLNLPHRDLVTGALFAVALGLVAGAVPSIQAMRLQIATALRRN
jgi:putative ABC transport system permease protein